MEARQIARDAGLHYVYLGNCPEVPDAETTFCPGCKRPVIERDVFSVRSMNLKAASAGPAARPSPASGPSADLAAQRFGDE